MNTRELLEMASLDAMGLLDQDEREAFEEAFKAAPPHVQAQIRLEQTNATQAQIAHLPEATLPASLRARVLAAVKSAMEAVASAAEKPSAAVIGRIAPATWAVRRLVSPLWRAACIGFATATVVLFGAVYQIVSEHRDAMRSGYDGQLAQLIAQDLGAGFVDVLLGENARLVAFRPNHHAAATDAAATVAAAAALPPQATLADAVVLMDAERQVAYLVCNSLPVVEGVYRLVVLDGAGALADTLTTFTAKGGIQGLPVAFTDALAGQLAIVAPGAATPLLLSI